MSTTTFQSILTYCARQADGIAAFDYMLASEDELAGDILGWAVRDLAGRRLGIPAKDSFTERQDEMNTEIARIRAEIHGDIAARMQQAKGRKYTGWSKRSTQPIRYAD